jgi:hypothetical protein
MLETLAPVVVGGLLALLGGAGTQWYLHHLKVRDEKRAKRSAKFEEMMVALHEWDHWLGRNRNYRVFGVGEEPAMSPSPRVRAICSLYFPSLTQRLKELDLAADRYELWMMQSGQKRLQAGGRQVFDEGAMDVYQPYLDLRHQLIKDLEALANRELQ